MTATWSADGFVIGFPYGPDTDWLKNAVAKGWAVVTYQGGSYRCDGPEIVSSSEAASDFSARERRVLRLMSVDECLRLHRLGTAEDP